MLEDAGLIIVLLLAARGYFACASDLGRMFKVHFCEKARDDQHEQVYDGPRYWGPE